MRGKWVVVVALVVGILTGVTAWAQTGIRVIVDGNEIKPDVPPQIINGRTLVPLRAVAEALGASVSWTETARTVTIQTYTSEEEVRRLAAEAFDAIQKTLQQGVASQNDLERAKAQMDGYMQRLARVRLEPSPAPKVTAIYWWTIGMVNDHSMFLVATQLQSESATTQQRELYRNLAEGFKRGAAANSALLAMQLGKIPGLVAP